MGYRLLYGLKLLLPTFAEQILCLELVHCRYISLHVGEQSDRRKKQYVWNVSKYTDISFPLERGHFSSGTPRSWTWFCPKARPYLSITGDGFLMLEPPLSHLICLTLLFPKKNSLSRDGKQRLNVIK